MTNPKALVLSGDGINCESETSYGLKLAGFDAEPVHIFDLLNSPERLTDAQLLALPGGFSYGDEIASGKVLAVKVKERLREKLYEYIEKGHLVLGICNGFQVLTQLGLLPFSEHDAERIVTLTRNTQGHFINRWVKMKVTQGSTCPWFNSLDEIELPIRHGEGRLWLNQDDGNSVESVRQNAPLRYTEDVNGSFERIAALTNPRGTVLGIMPHPEAYVRFSQHPNWTHKKIGLTAQKTTSFNVELEDLMADVATGSQGQVATLNIEAAVEADGLRILKNARAMLS